MFKVIDKLCVGHTYCVSIEGDIKLLQNKLKLTDENGSDIMQWIILIGDENFDMSTIKSIKHYGCIECYDVPSIEGRYCVNFGEDHIFYDYDEILDDYDEDELNKIPYSKPHFVTMIYTSKSCVRNVLQQDNFPSGIYIDNDCGLILPIEIFVQQGMPLDIDDML